MAWPLSPLRIQSMRFMWHRRFSLSRFLVLVEGPRCAQAEACADFNAGLINQRKMGGTARPGVAGTSGPEIVRGDYRWRPGERLGAVTPQRTWTHPQTRAQRRRNISERRAAIAAEFSPAVGSSQPVAARRALRIDALHSPSWQILHSSPPTRMLRDFFRPCLAFP